MLTSTKRALNPSDDFLSFIVILLHYPNDHHAISLYPIQVKSSSLTVQVSLAYTPDTWLVEYPFTKEWEALSW